MLTNHWITTRTFHVVCTRKREFAFRLGNHRKREGKWALRRTMTALDEGDPVTLDWKVLLLFYSSNPISFCVILLFIPLLSPGW